MEDAQLYQQLLVARVLEGKEQSTCTFGIRRAKSLRLHMTEHHLHAFYHGIETFLPTYAANA